MATTYQTGAAELGQGFAPFPQGTVCVRKQEFEISAAIVTDDVFEMVPVYEGERVIDLMLIVDDLETTGTDTVIDVGDGDDPDRYIDGSTIGQAGGMARYGSGISGVAPANALNHVYAADDTIDVKFVVDPATSAVVGGIVLIATIAHA